MRRCRCGRPVAVTHYPRPTGTLRKQYARRCVACRKAHPAWGQSGAQITMQRGPKCRCACGTCPHTLTLCERKARLKRCHRCRQTCVSVMGRPPIQDISAEAIEAILARRRAWRRRGLLRSA